MLGLIALLFLIITLIIYFAITVAIVYHFRRYGLSPKTVNSLMAIFLLLSLFFFGFDLIFFARVPWQEISQNIGNFLKFKPPLP